MSNPRDGVTAEEAEQLKQGILGLADLTVSDEELDARLTPELRLIRKQSALMLPQDVVHWRGLNSQEVFIPYSQIARPTRCGLFGIATLGYPQSYVTCPECRALIEADDD